MRHGWIVTAVVAAMGLTGLTLTARAADEAGSKVSGVLIDTKCAKKFHDEKSAAEHPKACAAKCGAKGGFVVISGDKTLKLDDKGNDLAKEYLAKADSTTHVVVEGKVEGDTIAVTSIAEAPKTE